MKTSKITLAIAAIMLSMAVVVISCKKKDAAPEETPTATDSETAGASDNSMAERMSDDVSDMGGQASENGSMSSYRLAQGSSLLMACASVTYDSVVNKVITVTFNGQICMDGHTRSGSIIFDYSGSSLGARFYRHPGFKCVVTTSNYVVDGMAVTLSKTIRNTTSPNFNPSTTNLTWSDTTSVSIVKSNGTVAWTSNKEKTLLNTSDPSVYLGPLKAIVWSNAIIGITGNASGTTVKGESYTATVTSQLVRDMTCSPDTAHLGSHPFIHGTLDFTPGTKATRHIDYGYPNQGACDNQALVTIATYTAAITLP
ncbi:MAG: hypothetical protein HY840_11085 [Bacteroidetes bacterium]|nr:hypothetical protein [Bacteroidota bacterium]